MKIVLASTASIEVYRPTFPPVSTFEVVQLEPPSIDLANRRFPGGDFR